MSRCTAANSALLKNPLPTDTEPNNNLNPLSSSDLAGTSAEPPAANSEAPTAPNLPPSDGANGSVGKTDSAVPDATKETSAPGAAVMTGALPLTGDSSTGASSLPNKPAESTEDGVKDIAEAGDVSKPAAAIRPDGINNDAGVSAPLATSAGAHSALNGHDKNDTTGSTDLASEDKSNNTAPTEKQDVEMKEAPVASSTEQPSALASASPAAGADISGVAGATGAPTPTPALATPATAGTEATGEKRKADTGTKHSLEMPPEKKGKGALSKAVNNAKDAFEDVKEKAKPGKAKPGRKPGSKTKKEAPRPPVGRTERKTRSQARAE